VITGSITLPPLLELFLPLFWMLLVILLQPDILSGNQGVISFLGNDQKTPHRCIVQVKSGHVSSATIRDLKGTVEREKAELGMLITLEEPTAPMRKEAIEAGFYHSELMQRDYPKIQILTIADLLKKSEPQLPPRYSPYR
jgi:site-specific DNA-methyltransferase (adenine-specific)